MPTSVTEVQLVICDITRTTRVPYVELVTELQLRGFSPFEICDALIHLVKIGKILFDNMTLWSHW